MRRFPGWWLLIAVTLAWIGLCVFSIYARVYARDDGRYVAQDPAMHAWFDKLRSGKGLCCSITDGRIVADPDWGTEGANYWVNIDGRHVIVPDDAVIGEPNKFGQAVAWPVVDESGAVTIRCFMPGGGT
jgi:hypothetical protein